MGFIGAVVLLLIFLALIFHLIRLATKVESPFKKIFIIGYVSLLVFHILQNIGMTINYYLLPEFHYHLLVMAVVHYGV